MKYLKSNVVIEPLFKSWYAWPHLISPLTAALNVRGRHLKIMDSYLQSPHIHSLAVQNPKMKGGPFIDHDISRIEDIRALRDCTIDDQQALIELADKITELEKKLKTMATGYSLKTLYSEIPDILKGYVELTYDLNGQPSLRFFESLLYKSRYFQTSAQSISIWLTNNDERPFVLSTPRLADQHVLNLPIPFSHRGIDALSRMKREARNIDEIRTILNIQPSDDALFDTFFTPTPPAPYQAYTGEEIRMRYFGHACILIETQDVSILLDPLLSYYGYPQAINRYSDMDLPEKIDYVLITHNHQDHVLLETLLPLRHKVGCLVVPRTTSGALQDPNLKLMLNNIGFDQILEIGEMEEIKFADCTITGIPFMGEHSDLNIQTKTCYLVSIGNFKLMFMADSCNMEPKLYEHVRAEIGDVDVLFLGMECEGAPLSWLYGPLLSSDLPKDKDESRRLNGSNFVQARSLVDIFKPKEIYVYAMGQEPWLEFISSIKYTPESHPIVQSNKLISYCQQQGASAERLFGEKEIYYTRIESMK